MRVGDRRRSSAAFSVWEGAVAVRRAVFARSGGWPGPFFYAHEGIELAWRVWDAGAAVRYAGDLAVEHPLIGTTRHRDFYRLNARNRVWLAKRNLPWLFGVPYVLTWTAVHLVRSVALPRRARALAARLVGRAGGPMRAHAVRFAGTRSSEWHPWAAARRLTGSVRTPDPRSTRVPSPISALGARLRSSGGRLVRRLGLLPGGEPDGLGDDERLEGVVLPGRAIAFFPEPPRNAYQLEQWLCPLEALAERCGVAVITQDSRTAVRLRERTTIPVLCVGRTATLDRLVQRSSIALALYVSHHPRNFQMLRFPSVAHVYLGHGESDKAVSASNQLKAYDRVFVAGPAAEERVQTELMWFDASRMVRIGRPQAAAPDPPAGA